MDTRDAGRKGGENSRKNLTQEERTFLAQKANQARLDKRKKYAKNKP